MLCVMPDYVWYVESLHFDIDTFISAHYSEEASSFLDALLHRKIL